MRSVWDEGVSWAPASTVWEAAAGKPWIGEGKPEVVGLELTLAALETKVVVCSGLGASRPSDLEAVVVRCGEARGEVG